MKTWVLLTGASTGIGYELAKLFAAEGYPLVLNSRDEKRLQEVAAELKTKWNAQTMVLAKDLAKLEAPAEIFYALRQTPVGVLVNNAGFGSQHAFIEDEASLSAEMMHVNMDALVQLTRLFLPSMLARKEGRILNVASTAAFQPGPLMAIYYATKAFVFSFSVALSQELEGTGVTVTTLCPGLTRTAFQKRAGIGETPGWMGNMSAEAVARDGYRALMKGRPIVISGLMNRITSSLSRRLPPRFTAKIVKRINRHR